MRVRALATAAAVGLIFPVAAATTASAAPGDALVTVVHGITDPALAVVDVYVNGTLAFDNLAADEIDDAELPAGTYAIGVAPPDSDSSTDAILSESFDVAGDATIVAQVTAAGAPDLVAYPDDYSPTAAGNARVVVRHAAAAPPVSIDATIGTTTIPNVVANLSNGTQQSVEVAAGSYSLSVKVAGITVPGLVTTEALVAGQLYTIYAVGTSPATYAFLLDPVPVGQKAPVPATTPSPTTAAPVTTTTAAPVATTTRPAIPTAVPAGDGSSGWAGPLGVPALLAITLAVGLALAVGFGMRGNASHRR